MTLYHSKKLIKIEKEKILENIECLVEFIEDTLKSYLCGRTLWPLLAIYTIEDIENRITKSKNLLARLRSMDEIYVVHIEGPVSLDNLANWIARWRGLETRPTWCLLDRIGLLGSEASQ